MNKGTESAEELIHFIEKSPSPWHVSENAAGKLLEAGYEPLSETEKWTLRRGGRYFVRRFDSSLIAFRIPEKGSGSFQMIASHTDSPSFKIKESPEIKADGNCVVLNVEKYGGMLIAPWFDKPLSVAGRVMVRTEKGLECRLVSIDRDLLMIPSLAIHMDRQANEGHVIRLQKEIRPIFGESASQGHFMKMIAEAAHCEDSDIVGHDLILYCRTRGCIWGDGDTYFSSPKIDDLMCLHSSLKAFLAAAPGENIDLLCLFDNEEVGSLTKQGACSMYLSDTLRRISMALGRTEEEHMLAVNSSFMVSADNGHAVHPNFPEKADLTNRPIMNGGVLIKYNASQKYTTDAISGAIFSEVCRRAGVPTQNYANNSDIPGGWTLGNKANSQVPLNTADIGAAQLAMHSPYETAGVHDVDHLINGMKAFYETDIIRSGNSYLLK